MNGRQKAFEILREDALRHAREAEKLIRTADGMLESARDETHFREAREAALTLRAALEQAGGTWWNSLASWDERA